MYPLFRYHIPHYKRHPAVSAQPRNSFPASHEQFHPPFITFLFLPRRGPPPSSFLHTVDIYPPLSHTLDTYHSQTGNYLTTNYRPVKYRRRQLAAEQQSSKAAEQQSSRAAEQQSSRAAEQQSSRAAEQQSSRAAEQQSSRAAAYSYTVAGLYLLPSLLVG